MWHRAPRTFVEVDRYAIAWRKLGYSMGLILETRGDPTGDAVATIFSLHTLGLRGKLSLIGLSAMTESVVWSSHDEDKYRVKH